MISNQATAQESDSAATATLSGKVVNTTSQKPLNGIDVQLQKEGETATTDQQGMYSFEDLKPGKYTVVVEVDGYKTWTKDVKLTTEGKTLDIKLEPSMDK
ncbi:MAG TPA: carboxypeptidase regulatory-like domain-containing protein [Balneolaceae bacterium]|nr:carboxypeptidase regulatory-like domain-containing protein [Balneolaceae bacterium]